MGKNQPYFLGTHDSEQIRLQFQAKAWKDISLQLCKDAGITKGHRVVDLGCGPGYFTFELSAMVGETGYVLAVDKSLDFLTTLEETSKNLKVKNVFTLCHDIEAAPLPEDGFDYVFVRWLHPYVNHLAALVSKELACLKAGGRIISLGTFNYQGVCMGPWSEDFNLITRKIIEFYEINKRPISAENSIPRLLSDQGASLIQLKNVSQIAQPDEDLWEWYRQFSFSMLPRLLEANLINESQAALYEGLWEKESKTPGAFICVPSHLGIIGEKSR